MKFRLSTYWKCQLIGWSTAWFIQYVAVKTINPGASNIFIVSIINAMLGLMASHILRFIIKKLGIFNKSFTLQVVYLALLDIVVSFITALVIVGAVQLVLPNVKNPFLGFITSMYYIQLLRITAWVAIYFLVQYIRKIKKTEYEKASLKIQVLESEARALRAQMNPHFIFNCLNSIKSLINKNENDKATAYLTTFSRLIMTLFHNSGKREVSLYEELETCKLYTELEKMRFGNKLSFDFDIDGSVDLKEFKIPALIIQPFIENAIWHGLVPKESGGNVLVSAKGNKHIVQCIVDDNGIGRELSKQYAPEHAVDHQSKGIRLTQSRLELDKILNERDNIIEIVDKKDSEGYGTKVILTFKEFC